MANTFKMVRSTVSSMISGIVRSVFSVASLFKDGQQGFWYDPTEIDTLYQDSAGTTPVTLAGEPVGLVIDKSGNTNNATQSISASRPTYNVNPERLTLDKVDDSIIVNIPTGGWVGSMVLATDQGTASYGVNIPAGDYEIGGIYFPGDTINNVLIREGVVSASDLAQTEATFVAGGAKASYGDVTDFTSYWREMGGLTSFPLIDTSSGTSFYAAWRNNSLTSFPLIDTSSGNSFAYAWYGNSTLVDFPASFFDNCLATNFTNAFITTNLSQTSIDGILVSINSNNTRNGTFNQSGGSAPSATGEAAITAMRSRGWTVTVTGGF